MKPDLYTKAVLTVIAACLVYLALGRPSIVTPVTGAAAATDVIIVGWRDKDNQERALPAPSTTGDRRAAPLPVQR